jgi:hypothetical protein
MTQYVIQIVTETGCLAKSFEVSDLHPIPSYVPPERVQIIMTNSQNFSEIVATFEEYPTVTVFSYNDVEHTISCDAPPEAVCTWSID